MFLNMKICMRRKNLRAMHMTVKKCETRPEQTAIKAPELINRRKGGHNDKRIDSGSGNAFP